MLRKTKDFTAVNAALMAVWSGPGQRPDVIPKWWEGVTDGLPKWKWPEPRHVFFNPLLGMMYGLRPEVMGAPDRIIIPHSTYRLLFGWPIVNLLLRGRTTRRPARFTRKRSKV